MIIAGKLREGIYASNRRDMFAVEGAVPCRIDIIFFADAQAVRVSLAYETSLFLSIIFISPRQTTSIISHLLPGLYSSETPPESHPTAVLLSLLHHLIMSLPSQRLYYDHL